MMPENDHNIRFLIPTPEEPQAVIDRAVSEAIEQRERRNKILEGWDSKQMRNYLYLVLEQGGLERDYAKFNGYLDRIDSWIHKAHIHFNIKRIQIAACHLLPEILKSRSERQDSWREMKGIQTVEGLIEHAKIEGAPIAHLETLTAILKARSSTRSSHWKPLHLPLFLLFVELERLDHQETLNDFGYRQKARAVRNLFEEFSFIWGEVKDKINTLNDIRTRFLKNYDGESFKSALVLKLPDEIKPGCNLLLTGRIDLLLEFAPDLA